MYQTRGPVSWVLTRFASGGRIFGTTRPLSNLQLPESVLIHVACKHTALGLTRALSRSTSGLRRFLSRKKERKVRPRYPISRLAPYGVGTRKACRGMLGYPMTCPME